MNADTRDLVLGIGLILLALNVMFLIFRVYTLRDRIERLEDLHEDKLEATYPPSVKLTHIVYTGTVGEPKK